MKARALALTLLLAPPAEAQISPGPLARGHERLEGSAQCLKCHDQKGVSAERCLACHTLLAERVAAGRGLHARAEYRDCKRCHMEHQGREFELVFWGERGRAGFDHALTGLGLQGRHARLRCEDCHRGRQRRSPQQLAAAGAGAGTFLGLATGCAACHADEHRGQLGARDCTVCHRQESWKPAPGFDHARAAFKLEGRHVGLACDKCHPTVPEGGKSYRRYVPVAFKECSSCHRDPHAGRLGAACSSCHAVDSWRPQKLAGFDHDRTAYPLRGRHRGLDCSACHRANQGYKLAHARCLDCHADAHLGQLSARADQGRCEACHDVSGFSPAHFGPEEHGRTRYALVGAHLAVPCDACHKRVSPESLGRLPAAGPALAGRRPGPATRLRFASTRCVDCHKDPHLGEVDKHMRTAGCEACHAVDSWRQVRFEHDKTRFALAGAHARLACGKCHERLEAGTPRQRPKLAGLALACEGCHKDPHQGQLTRADLASPCERCHTTTDWKPTRFDHARDSTFALDGAHVRLGCVTCHKAETQGGQKLVRYKPLRTACRDCHAGRLAGAREGTSR